jgi:hypothetical protein
VQGSKTAKFPAFSSGPGASLPELRKGHGWRHLRFDYRLGSGKDTAILPLSALIAAGPVNLG